MLERMQESHALPSAGRWDCTQHLEAKLSRIARAIEGPSNPYVTIEAQPASGVRPTKLPQCDCGQEGPCGCLELFTMTPLASTPLASWWQDVFDARFTCVSTDPTQQCLSPRQQPEPSTHASTSHPQRNATCPGHMRPPQTMRAREGRFFLTHL